MIGGTPTARFKKEQKETRRGQTAATSSSMKGEAQIALRYLGGGSDGKAPWLAVNQKWHSGERLCVVPHSPCIRGGLKKGKRK